MSTLEFIAQSPDILILLLVIALAGAAAFVLPIARAVREKGETAEAQADQRVHDPALSFSLGEIWGIEDRARFLHAIDLWLVRKQDRHINSGCTEPALSAAERTAYDVLTFDLHAYFNGLYDFWLCYGCDDDAGAYEAALTEIGALPAAELWHDAVALIENSPGDPVDPMPDDPELVRALSVLDFGYSKNSENVKELVYRYIQLHKGEFSE